MDVVGDLEDRLEIVGIVSYGWEAVQDCFWQLWRYCCCDWCSISESVCGRADCAIAGWTGCLSRRGKIGSRIRRENIECEWAFQLFSRVLKIISRVYKRRWSAHGTGHLGILFASYRGIHGEVFDIVSSTLRLDLYVGGANDEDEAEWHEMTVIEVKRGELIDGWGAAPYCLYLLQTKNHQPLALSFVNDETKMN